MLPQVEQQTTRARKDLIMEIAPVELPRIAKQLPTLSESFFPETKFSDQITQPRNGAVQVYFQNSLDAVVLLFMFAMSRPGAELKEEKKTLRSRKKALLIMKRKQKLNFIKA